MRRVMLLLFFTAAILFVPSGLQGSPGTWNATASMANARQLHTATRLSDGRVLVAGGVTTGGGATATAELYDPSTGTWSSAASMHVAREGFQNAVRRVSAQQLLCPLW